MAKQKSSGWLDKYQEGGEVEGEDKYVDPSHTSGARKLDSILGSVDAFLHSNSMAANSMNALGKTIAAPFVGAYNLLETGAAQFYKNQTQADKEKIFQKYRPIEYPGFFKGLGYNLASTKPRMDDKGNYALEEEIWRQSLGLPGKSNYIQESKYKPTSSKDPNAKYYSFHPNVIDTKKLIEYTNNPETWNKNKKISKNGKEYLQMSALHPFMKEEFVNRQVFDKETQSVKDIDPLQNFQIYKGYDPVKKKNYISISDKYDFDFKPIQEVSKPIEIYDRFYYNDGGPVQPNYNDASVSYPPNFVGEGTINGPNWKSPAWGGQFKNGGKVCDSCEKAQDGKKLSGAEKRKRALEQAEKIFSSNDLPYKIPENVVSAGGNSGYVCIQGVCGIMTDAGLVPHGYYTNTSFAEHSKDLGFSRALADINQLKGGDVFQWMQHTNDQGKHYPTHAQIYKGRNPDTGEHEFYDYYNKYNGYGDGLRSYSDDEIKAALNRFANRDESGDQAQFFSLDPEGLPKEAPQPFPYNLPQKEQEAYFDATHVANTKYYPGDAAQGPLLDVPSYERMQTKHELADLFNDKELDKKLRKELKITDQDLQKAKPLIYGIMDQETDFGNPRSAGRNIKYGLKELLGSGAYSMGPAAIRYDEALSDEAKKAFGIKGPHDLSKVKNAYIGALDVLSKGARYTDNNVTGHPGLEDKDRMERALYWYNNPSNVVNSDAETFQAISKEANNLFPWQDRQELMSKAYRSPLEMSPGSYPDKVLKQSKGLHQVIDFEDMNMLPEVRVVAPKDEIVETTGGEFAMGGSVPGAVGFTYARTINPAPSNGPYAKKTKASAQNGTWLDKGINKLYDAEDNLTKWLGNPMQKATNIAKEASYKHLGSMDDPIDSYRHSMAGNYTSKAIQDKLYNIPLISQAAGFVGANVLGAGHEISTLIGHAPEFGGDDDRPWFDKIKESGEDAFNNMVGAGVGSIPLMSAKQKSDLLLNLSLNNRLPDGHGQGNMYIKKKQNGGEMKYYQDGLDFKPKSISKNGSVIKDDMGQWAHPGKVTQIGSNQITMQGVPYPVLGISDTGDTQMMYPNQEYKYNGNSVTEYPMAQNGENVAYADNTRLGAVPRYPRPSYRAPQDFSGLIKAADVVTDVMQLGHFIPHPIPQGIAFAGDFFGAGIDSYQAIDEASKGNYGAAGINAASAFLPGYLKSAGYLRSAANATPGSIAEKIAKLGLGAGNYRPLTALPRLANNSVIKKGIKANRAVAGALGAETVYDKYEQGGQLTKLDQLTNFTNYNTKQPGGWLDKYQD